MLIPNSSGVAAPVAGGFVVVIVVAASFVYLSSISYPDSTQILTEKFLKRLSYNTSLIMFTQESSSPPLPNTPRNNKEDE